MASVKEMEAQVNGELAPQVAQIKALFHAVAARSELTDVAGWAVTLPVVTRKGYVRYDAAKGLHVFTPKGTKFYAALKRFG